jgi:hypothetical protein
VIKKRISRTETPWIAAAKTFERAHAAKLSNVNQLRSPAEPNLGAFDTTRIAGLLN